MRGSVIGLFLLGGLAACTHESTSDATEADVAPVIQSRVRVLDAEPGPDLELHDNELVAPRGRFPDLEHANAGDVLVSGRAAGFLREVRSVRIEGDKVIAETNPASLESVFEEVRVRGSLNGELAPPVVPNAPGLGTESVRLAVPDLSLKGKKLSIGENSEIEIVDGSFDFQPNLDFDLSMHHGKVEHLKVLASGASVAGLHVRYHLKKSGNLQSGLFVRMSNGTPLLETAPVYAVFWAGYVPIVVSVRARLLANWELLVGGDVSGEQDVQATGKVAAGLEYNDGAWKNLGEKSLAFSHDSTTKLASHSLSGNVTLTARLDVSFYELAGPYVGLEAYAGIKHAGNEESSGWFLQDGLRGLAGAQVAVFGKSLAGYEAVLFDAHNEVPMP